MKNSRNANDEMMEKHQQKGTLSRTVSSVRHSGTPAHYRGAGVVAHCAAEHSAAVRDGLAHSPLCLTSDPSAAAGTPAHSRGAGGVAHFAAENCSRRPSVGDCLRRLRLATAGTRDNSS